LIIKIYSKMEKYDNIASKVYSINDRYKVSSPNKNDRISKETLINVKYKMNQQLEKEKVKISKLTEDNSKLQNRIKSLERKCLLKFKFNKIYYQ